MTQRILGLIVIGVSLLPAYHFLWVIWFGGVFWLGECYVVALSVLGVWLIYDSFKTGHYLDVRLRHGRERLPFTSKSTETDLQSFVDGGRAQFGYAIHQA